MRWIDILKQRCKRFYLRASWVPFDDAPLSEWQHFAEAAPRWLVEEVAEEWVSEFFAASQWDAVYSILKRRCERLEYPVLGKSFMEENSNRICIVPDDSSRGEVKVLAERSEKEYPFYVVEQSGKFRGIAVTYGLVLAGVLNRFCVAQKEQKLQDVNLSESLSLKDFGFLTSLQDEVSKMLQEAGLEPLQGRYWYRSDGSAGVWDIHSGSNFSGTDEAFVISKI